MAKDFLKEDPMKDLDAQLNADFNKLVRKIHKGLSTKKRVILLYILNCP